MANQTFWGTAMLSFFLSFGFAYIQRKLITTSQRELHISVAKGQEQDNWLVCIMVWAVILSGKSELKEPLQWIGTVVLVWSSWRTLWRASVLLRSKD